MSKIYQEWRTLSFLYIWLLDYWNNRLNFLQFLFTAIAVANSKGRTLLIWLNFFNTIFIWFGFFFEDLSQVCTCFHRGGSQPFTNINHLHLALTSRMISLVCWLSHVPIFNYSLKSTLLMISRVLFLTERLCEEFSCYVISSPVKTFCHY